MTADQVKPATESEAKRKRHNWSRGNGWCYCVDCHCRYKTGNLTREYEQPDGRRTSNAEECRP